MTHLSEFDIKQETANEMAERLFVVINEDNFLEAVSKFGRDELISRISRDSSMISMSDRKQISQIGAEIEVVRNESLMYELVFCGKKFDVNEEVKRVIAEKVDELIADYEVNNV
jgi:uncharacterized protein YicC (UPF0701 family)